MTREPFPFEHEVYGNETSEDLPAWRLLTLGVQTELKEISDFVVRESAAITRAAEEFAKLIADDNAAREARRLAGGK